MERDIQRQINAFHNPLVADPNHRYRSWEHCYRVFRSRSDADINTLCLHLAFYLASWGMYRGSSFLLWKDYLIHKPIVKILCDDKHAPLFRINHDDPSDDRWTVPLMLKLVERIREAYERIDSVNCETKSVRASDTLVTKVIMGTVGCLPAYDRYVVAGMRHKGVAYSGLSSTHISSLLTFYRANAEEFKKAQTRVSSPALRYPIMKVLDMYFWSIGNELLASGG
ncbi:MAG TPA: hypothetical protein PLE77_03005 [Kiritimatiellia bacterium]|nr:hypothetical protein [Kiritimatiellia bacterium]